MSAREGPLSNSAKFVSHTGRTRTGQPLAFNHSPTPDLAPWFCWFSATHAELPDGARVTDGMLNDLPCLRIMFGGRWTAETADGTIEFAPGETGRAFYFGPHSRVLPIAAEGSFKVITVQLAPGASAVMGGPSQVEALDRLIDHDTLAGHGRLAERFDPSGTPEQWLATFEHELSTFVEHNRTPPPDALTTAFERCALADPGIEVADFAEQEGVTARTVERMARRDYGLTPKQVLRRARALDMAAALLGVAMEDEEAELRLRYFDQSHLNREIRAFFGTTPRGLRKGAHPLLRLNLEVRQARRLAALALLPSSTLNPWRDPSGEPSRTAS